MIWVTKAKYLSDFKVDVTFSTGELFTIDLKDELTGEIFKALQDPKVFATLKYETELDTIVWENGADFAPEFLYELASEQMQKKEQALP